MDFKEKYLKYKKKYLDLKINMSGGNYVYICYETIEYYLYLLNNNLYQPISESYINTPSEYKDILNSYLQKKINCTGCSEGSCVELTQAEFTTFIIIKKIIENNCKHLNIYICQTTLEKYIKQIEGYKNKYNHPEESIKILDNYIRILTKFKENSRNTCDCRSYDTNKLCINLLNENAYIFYKIENYIKINIERSAYYY